MCFNHPFGSSAVETYREVAFHDSWAFPIISWWTQRRIESHPVFCLGFFLRRFSSTTANAALEAERTAFDHNSAYTAVIAIGFTQVIATLMNAESPILLTCWRASDISTPLFAASESIILSIFVVLKLSIDNERGFESCKVCGFTGAAIVSLELCGVTFMRGKHGFILATLFSSIFARNLLSLNRNDPYPFLCIQVIPSLAPSQNNSRNSGTDGGSKAHQIGMYLDGLISASKQYNGHTVIVFSLSVGIILATPPSNANLPSKPLCLEVNWIGKPAKGVAVQEAIKISKYSSLL
mmetsp:Transcript_10582/g.17277  ORF Transcript_10582/g.17277 Transcript_10582/m.17277 type:complete len:294 (+) Transcript_10582:1416-2297(+)